MMRALEVIGRYRTWGCDIAPVLAWLKSLPGNSVHNWITSPPYYGLRSYLPDGHPDKAHEIGTEKTPEEYVEKLGEVFEEAYRALHPSGILYLNLGDTYANDVKGPNGSERNLPMPSKSWRGSFNLKKKDLIGVPWRVAFALQSNGWYLRQWMPWVKRNPMTESVDDRPSSACESVFLFSKTPDYFYDHFAIRREDSGKRQGNIIGFERPERVSMGGRGSNQNWEPGGGRSFRNNDLWFDSVGMLLNDEGDGLGLDTVVGNFPGQHFAVFPRALVEPLILSGSSAHGVCPKCGNPWDRMIERERVPTRPGTNTKVGDAERQAPANWSHPNAIGNRDPQRHCTIMTHHGWAAGCGHGLEPAPAVVGDMFAGTGTTLAIAREHGRFAIGCDLDERNMAHVLERMGAVQPTLESLFSE